VGSVAKNLTVHNMLHPRCTTAELFHNHSLGTLKVLPHTAHLRRRRGGGGVEVRGAEAVVRRGGDVKPKAAPEDVLRLDVERERPVAFLPPSAARRVEGVDADAIHVRPDGCAAPATTWERTWEPPATAPSGPPSGQAIEVAGRAPIVAG